MRVRRMTEEDCTQVAEIEAENFSMPWSRMDFLKAVQSPEYLYLVAEENGEILGYCGCIIVLDEAEIPNVCVCKSARKQGIGRNMLQKLLGEAKKRNVTVLYLEVRQSNAAAQALYRQLGFEEIGIRKNFYERPQENAVLMNCILRSEVI